MSTVRLIFKQKMVLNIPIFRMQEKMQFSNNSINCLYYVTLHIESACDQYGVDLSKMGLLPC